MATSFLSWIADAKYRGGGMGSATGGALLQDAGLLTYPRRERRHLAVARAGVHAARQPPAPARSPCSEPRTATREAAFPQSLRRTRSSSRTRPASDAPARR